MEVEILLLKHKTTLFLFKLNIMKTTNQLLLISILNLIEYYTYLLNTDENDISYNKALQQLSVRNFIPYYYNFIRNYIEENRLSKCKYWFLTLFCKTKHCRRIVYLKYLKIKLEKTITIKKEDIKGYLFIPEIEEYAYIKDNELLTGDINNATLFSLKDSVLIKDTIELDSMFMIKY